MFQHTAARRRLRRQTGRQSRWRCFNTQPPEGGCLAYLGYFQNQRWFQHTAARRRLPLREDLQDRINRVSTHSRPKAAALREWLIGKDGIVSTHSRPKAAASRLPKSRQPKSVSTHSRPKAAAGKPLPSLDHTGVSTHSRPKAAAGVCSLPRSPQMCFNTQPPEGGCSPSRSPHPQRLSRLCFAKLRGKTVGRVWHSLGLLFPPR